MGTRSKGPLLGGLPRERHPLAADNVVEMFRFFHTPGFPRPPKKQLLKSGKRFRNCRRPK